MTSQPPCQLQQENDRLTAELAQLRQECDRLRKSESRYRQVVENSPISILFIDTQGYITQMNQASEEFFGLSIKQLNQQACPIFDNLQLVKNGALPQMLWALSGETAIVNCADYYDSSSNFADGRKIFGKGHYCPIRDESGIVREIVEIAPDFSDLWAAQQALQVERDRAATERAHLLTTVAQVANLLLKAPDYTTVLPGVVQLLGEAVGSDRCSVMQDAGIHPTFGKPARLFMDSRDLLEQALQQRWQQGFTPFSDIVNELKEA